MNDVASEGGKHGEEGAPALGSMVAAIAALQDYDRYLSTCVKAFDNHYSSLAQYALKRID